MKSFNNYFRYVLIKYSNRGLVKNGVISELFEQLYLTVFAAVNIVLFAAIVGSRHFKTDTDDEPILMSLCLKKSFSFHQNSFLSYGGFLFVIFITTWLMYGSSIYLIRSKSKNGKMPQKFGRYQRNVVTFIQTVLFNSVQEVVFSFVALFPTVLDLGASPENIQRFVLAAVLFYSIIFHFLIPIIIISRLKTRIPALFLDESRNVLKRNSFYVKQPELVPRRDVTDVKSNSMSLSNVIIKVEEANL